MKVTIEIHRPGWMTSRRVKRARPLVLLLGLVLVGPVLAADRFSDVPASNIHHDDISAIAAAGITRGCNEGGTLYCPETVVNREQIGSFLARTAGLGGHPPVTNADKLDGMDSSAFLPAADYTVMQMGPWQSEGSSGLTVQHFAVATHVLGPPSFGRRTLLHLDGPASVGGTAYGFESARICFEASRDATITGTDVVQATDAGAIVLAQDPTDRPMASDECYTVSDGTPTVAVGGTTLILELEYGEISDDGGEAQLKSVTTTWTPVSP